MRDVDKTRWKGELHDVGVNFEELAVATNVMKLTIFVFFRLFMLCPSIAHFREAVLKVLGHDPRDMPQTVIPLDNLGKVANKIAHTRSLKRRADLEAYENTEIRFEQIRFFVPTEFPPSMLPYPPPVDDSDYEPLPKIGRLSIDLPPVTSKFENQFYNERKRCEYWKTKYQSVELKLKEFSSVRESNVKLQSELLKANETIEKLHCQLYQLENDLDKANNTIQQPPVSKEVDNQFKMKTSRNSFTAEAHMLFAQLAIDYQIAETKVGGVISCVANFFKVIVEAVPSARTVGRSIHVAAAAMACQIMDVISRSEIEFTLLSDETTKKYNKLQAYVATYLNDQTKELERIYFEVEAVANKSSQRQFDAFRSAVEGIALKAKKTGSAAFDQFILQIKNLMGDQARTQIKFAEILTKYREIVKRTVDPEFEKLPEEQQNIFLRTNLLFCFLHLTSNSTPHILEVLKDDERKQIGKVGKKSTVEALLIELGRFFGSRAAARYPSAGEWRLHCKAKGIKHGKIESYSKSRFHSLFTISVQVLQNKDRLISFISDTFKDGGIKEFLLNGLQNELIMSHIMILAAYEVNILGPLWRLAEKSPTPRESSAWINSILKFFDSVASNPMLLFSNNSPLDQFEGSLPTKKSSVAHRALLETLNPPTGSSLLVTDISNVLTKYFEKQFERYLSDEFINFDDLSKGVPLTNVACESVFSTIDWSYRRQPNMNVRKRATETAILKNRTFQYLLTLSEEARQEIYKHALSNRAAVESYERQKSAQYSAELIKAMEEKELERARNRKKLQQKKTKLLEDIQSVGIWKSVAELHEAIASLRPTKAMQAVKLNLRYQKLHNGKAFDDKLFRFQNSGHKYTLDELISNLSEVIEMNKDAEVFYDDDDSDVDGISDEDEDE